jgi:hypothetical protein
VVDGILERLRELTDQAAKATQVELVPEQVDNQTFLPEVLESLGLAALLTLAEDEWDIKFHDDEITPQLFWRLPSLASAIRTKVERR